MRRKRRVRSKVPYNSFLLGVDASSGRLESEVSSQLRTDAALGMSVSGSQVNLRLPARESRGSAKARVELIRSARPCGLIWGECKALDGSSFAWWLGWA